MVADLKFRGILVNISHEVLHSKRRTASGMGINIRGCGVVLCPLSRSHLRTVAFCTATEHNTDIETHRTVRWSRAVLCTRRVVSPWIAAVMGKRI